MLQLTFVTFALLSLFNKVTNEPYSLYEHIENLNASCFPLDSCSVLLHSKFDHLWKQRLCECGPHCVRFGTCCADSTHVFEKLPLLLPEQERCEKLEYFSMPVIMVSQCDDNWPWPSSIIEKCEKGNFSTNDSLLSNIPLTNVKTLTTYKNYFCALCNYGGNDFFFWKVRLEVEGRQILINSLVKYGKPYVLKNIKYDDRKKNWIYLDKQGGNRLTVKVQYILPVYMYKIVKPCYTNLVQTCKSSRSRALIKLECQTYYSPIKITTQAETFVYKNIHCAMCNSVNMSSASISSCMGNTQMKVEKYRENSFAILMDMNFKKGNVLGRTYVSEPDCGPKAVYDPMGKKCRKIICLKEIGQVWENGKCVPRGH